jgi:hypothetical protein
MNSLNSDLGGKGSSDPFKLNPAPAEVLMPDQTKKDDLFKDYSAELRIVIQLLKMIYGFLLKVQAQIDTTQSLNAKDSIIYNLKMLKMLFSQLQEQELSQNLDFALSLSVTWHEVIDYFALAPKHERKNDFFKEGSLLIESINLFPPGEEHSLGFYLTHYAGENWLPFPFMAIIRLLHDEHAKDSTSSHLEVWIKTIGTLVDNFTRAALSTPHLAPN